MALVVGLPQIFWSTQGSAVKTQSFIAWQFGWDSDQEAMFGSKPVGTQPIETVPPIKKWLQARTLRRVVLAEEHRLVHPAPDPRVGLEA